MAVPAAIPILFGTETFNALDLAQRLAGELAAADVPARAVDMAEYDASCLARERAVVVITSTYGNGGPPPNAKALHAQLLDAAAPRLDGVAFAVLALGDRTYSRFCQCGREFDERLAGLGGRRLLPRVECDGDPEEQFTSWAPRVREVLRGLASGSETFIEVLAATKPTGEPAAAPRATAWADVPIVAMRRLTAAGSDKDTRHFELELGDTGIDARVGDRLAVRPRNAPEVVAEVLALTGISAGHVVRTAAGASLTFEAFVAEEMELAYGTPALVQLLAPEWRRGATPGDVDGLAATHDGLALLRRFGRGVAGPEELASAWEPLQPRLYSLASSPRAHGTRAHLTVAMVARPDSAGLREGVASSWLARCHREGHAVAVRASAAPHFRLPQDAAPIVMIGPGTGLAPFMGFLAHREATGQGGPAWLVTGFRRPGEDDLYMTELERWRACGVLDRLDVAYSRVSGGRYVQDVLAARRTELAHLLSRGAHVYLCGEGRRMAPAVEAQVAAAAGDDQAFAVLRGAGRWHVDVY
jgi:sulfite reductase (NADPH) flavoprotein alpha-component